MTMIRTRAARHLRPIARLLLSILATLALVAGIGSFAAGQPAELRDPGQSLVREMDLDGADLARVRSRAGTVARALGIVGEPGVPHRKFEALDHAVIDEVTVSQPDGRVVAVMRLDADRGGLRSLVRMAWSVDDDGAQTSAATAPDAASRYAEAMGIAAPATLPGTAWDEAMRAWRVSWPRLIEGIAAPGEGLTLWVYPGGRLAAMRRIETPAASAPLLRIAPDRAKRAARAWAAGAGIPDGILTVAATPPLAWVAPDDFASRGGAEATEARLYLAYTVQLTVRPPGGDVREVLLFVDAGSGAVIGGVESA
jgi:hypothetical protein